MPPPYFRFSWFGWFHDQYHIGHGGDRSIFLEVNMPVRNQYLISCHWYAAVGVNGVPEAIVAAILTAAIVTPLLKILKRG